MASTGETLLSASAVKLYGRVIAGLEINSELAGQELGANKFLREQFDFEKNKAAAPTLARIYGFSYFGRYTPLSRPAIFLVHGSGEEVSAADDASLGNLTTPVDQSGVAVKDWKFSSGIRVWEYDRGDFSLRLDVDSGPLERILVGREEADDEMPYFRGAKTRLRGTGE